MRVHQIWIGGRPAPARWMQTVSEFCRRYGHEYVLWRNAEVSRIDLARYPGLVELFEEYSRCETRYRYAGQADILRLIILCDEGGIYLDADMVVVNPTAFAHFLDGMGGRVFAGWESPGKLVANSVIGAPKEHLFLRDCLDQLPVFAKEAAARPVWHRTGPFFLTEMLNRWEHLQRDDFVIVPQSYFYPGGWHRVRDASMHERHTFSPETLLFQYGYTTNNLGDVLDHGPIGRMATAISRPFGRLRRSLVKRLRPDRS